MIKNQRQYFHAKKQAAQFREALKRAKEEPRQADVHPIMHRAYIDGLENQVETLENEISEFETLSEGDVELIQLDRLENLPLGLIKARIARGLSHKQLGERLGVKAQQIQRWEHEEYENLGFKRLIEIARALEICVAESIYLPKKGRTALAALKSLGIDRQFLTTRLVPRYSTAIQSGAGEVIAAATRLSKIFGIELLSDGTLTHSDQLLNAGATLRFKIPSNAEGQRIRAYALYVSYLATIVVASISTEDASSIPSTWQSMRKRLFPNGIVDYADAVRSVWEMGIPIIPLSDPVRFHGCCMRSGGRNIIVLKQSVRYTSRWLFDLVHELYHATEEPSADAFSKLDKDATHSGRREADAEHAANEFAGNVLLNGGAHSLYQEVLSCAGHALPRLKVATSQVSLRKSENVGVLANYVAYRLKIDHFVDWWGVAANLQPEGDDAFEITRHIFFEKVTLSQLEEEDRALIEQALSDPHL